MELPGPWTSSARDEQVRDNETKSHKSARVGRWIVRVSEVGSSSRVIALRWSSETGLRNRKGKCCDVTESSDEHIVSRLRRRTDDL